MTNKEAIQILSTRDKYGVPCGYTSGYQEALDMAIDALQTKMDGDTISRQDALKPFCVSPDGTRIPEVDCDNFPVEFSVEFIKKHLLSLPSAPDSRQRGEWVGCTGCKHYDQQQTAMICRDCKRYHKDMYEEW